MLKVIVFWNQWITCMWTKSNFHYNFLEATHIHSISTSAFQTCPDNAVFLDLHLVDVLYRVISWVYLAVGCLAFSIWLVKLPIKILCHTTRVPYVTSVSICGNSGQIKNKQLRQHWRSEWVAVYGDWMCCDVVLCGSFTQLQSIMSPFWWRSTQIQGPQSTVHSNGVWLDEVLMW